MARALPLASLLALAAATANAAPPQPGGSVAFVACPIARETGPDTDVCFVTEYEGQLYGLKNPTDWGEPQLRHKVLVEGKVGSGPKVCGATPIEGLASVLPEVDQNCNTVLPFDGSVVGARGGIFERGPPEARARARELARQAELNPALSVQPVMPDPPPEPAPAPPFETKTLTVIYPFGSDRGSGPDMLTITQLVRYAIAAKAEIEIAGHQGATRLATGEIMPEPDDMARLRAEKISGIMTGLGVPTGQVKAHWADAIPAPVGRGEDWKARRVDVTITPARVMR